MSRRSGSPQVSGTGGVIRPAMRTPFIKRRMPAGRRPGGAASTCRLPLLRFYAHPMPCALADAGTEVKAHWDATRDGTLGDSLIAAVPCQSTGKGTWQGIKASQRLPPRAVPPAFPPTACFPTSRLSGTPPASCLCLPGCRAVAASADTHGCEVHASHGAASNVGCPLAVGAGHVVS